MPARGEVSFSEPHYARRPAGAVLAIAVAILCSVEPTIADWFGGQQPKSDPHNIELFENLSQRVKAAVPKATNMGFLSDQSVETFYKFQYSMAPVLLTNSTSLPFVIGYFRSGTPAAVGAIQQRRLVVKADLGQGLYLLGQ
jgi:hypothetical protein